MKAKLIATVLLMHVTISICQAVPNLPVDGDQTVTLIEGTISIKAQFSELILKEIAKNKITVNSNYQYKIQVYKEKYEIITTMPPGNRALHEIISYDGSNQVYFLHLSNPSPKNANSATGYIDDTPVPRMYASYQVVIWMAFASSSYFLEKTNKIIESSFDCPQRWKFLRYQPGDWVLNKTNPYLPERVSIMCVPKFHNNEIVGINLPEPYQNGYLREEYTVDSFTNYQGKSYPNKFKYKVFSPKSIGGTSSNDLVETRMVFGTVDKISTISDWKHFEPQPISYVADLRGTNLNVQYFMTNYVVFNDKDVFTVKQKLRASKVVEINKEKNVEHMQRRKYVITFGVMSFFAFPAVMYIVYWGRSKKGKKK